MTPRKLTSQLKEAMMKHLVETDGNISKSAELTGVNRAAHYDWLKDEGYKSNYTAIMDKIGDAIESRVYTEAKSPEGQLTAAIFYLKCKRGWTEKHEVESNITIKFDGNNNL